MAISRPFLLALLGSVLLGVTFFAVQNARDTTSDDVAPAAQSAPEPQAAAPAEPAVSPEQVLEAALNPGQIDSTAFQVELGVRSGADRVSAELFGQFEKGAANDVPEFAIDARLAADGERVQGGFTSVGDKAYFTRGENSWRVPEQVWGPVVQAVATGGAQPQQQVLMGLDPMKWVKDAKLEGTETVDGVETNHVSASIDSGVIFKDLAGLARQSGADVPSAREVARSVKTADFDAWVGSDDRVLRRLTAEVVIAPKGEARSELNFEVDLTGVNEPQNIEAPSAVRAGMPDGTFGVFAQGLVAGLTGAGGGDPVSLAALTSPNPQRAARAVKAGKKVVILFENPRGLDDRLMGRVVRELDRRSQALVLTDHVDAVDRYGKMVQDLGVSQTPSVVIIDRTGQARLFEGYADTDTLAQAVADAR